MIDTFHFALMDYPTRVGECMEWFLKTEASPRTILVQFSSYPWPILYLFWSYFKSILTLHFSSNVQSKYFVSYFKSILVNSYLTTSLYIFSALFQAKNSVEISKKQKSQKYQTNVAFEIKECFGAFWMV